jgi:hypothetical protein
MSDGAFGPRKRLAVGGKQRVNGESSGARGLRVHKSVGATH